ncbi:HipA N-terminal domain-containing protein [Bartonella sp. AU15XJBT]
MTRTLDVYLHAKLVGQLQQEKRGDLTFFYDSDYLHQDL